VAAKLEVLLVELHSQGMCGRDCNEKMRRAVQKQDYVAAATAKEELLSINVEVVRLTTAQDEQVRR
jgi:hypothetical protein